MYKRVSLENGSTDLAYFVVFVSGQGLYKNLKIWEKLVKEQNKVLFWDICMN